MIACFVLLATFAFTSFTEEDCTETICPGGFNNCFEKPCD